MAGGRRAEKGDVARQDSRMEEALFRRAARDAEGGRHGPWPWKWRFGMEAGESEAGFGRGAPW